MKHLYFVRHGQAQANVDRVFAGHVDTPLTTKGREQAKEAGRNVKALGVRIDHIISSPLSRTYDTAKIISEAIGYPVDKIELNNLLMERNFGPAAGMSWDTDLDLDGIVDVETMNSVGERAHLAYKHILTLPYDTVLVIGHGTFWQKFYTAIHPNQKVTAADEPDNAEISKLV